MKKPSKSEEIDRIYKRACKARPAGPKTPEEEESRLWCKVLREFDPRDIQSGLDAWWASTERDLHQELRSRWLPAPAELKLLAEQAQRKREAAARAPQDMLIWRCEKGHTFTGFIAHGDLPPAKRCRVCNTPMACERTAA